MKKCTTAQNNLSEFRKNHSRPQNPPSFWPAAGIESFGWTSAGPTVGRTRFSEDAQSIRFVFSANQICQI